MSGALKKKKNSGGSQKRKYELRTFVTLFSKSSVRADHYTNRKTDACEGL